MFERYQNRDMLSHDSSESSVASALFPSEAKNSRVAAITPDRSAALAAASDAATSADRTAGENVRKGVSFQVAPEDVTHGLAQQKRPSFLSGVTASATPTTPTRASMRVNLPASETARTTASPAERAVSVQPTPASVSSEAVPSSSIALNNYCGTAPPPVGR